MKGSTVDPQAGRIAFFAIRLSA